MKRAAALLLGLVLAGCSGSSGGDPVAQPQVDLGQFVRGQIAATADTTEPIELNDIDFDDQTAFDPFLDLLR